MSKANISDSVFEALFRQAVIDNFNQSLLAMPSEKELAETITFSPRHEERMKKLFARDIRRERIDAALKWARRSAAAVFIAATLLFGALMFVPDVRAVVVDTVVQWFEQFTKFVSGKPAQSSKQMEPTYIPDGFTETARVEVDDFLSITYMNDAGDTLLFTVVLADDSVSVDNETVEYRTVHYDDMTYYVFEDRSNEKNGTIIWDSEGNRYLISALLPSEELLEVALNVR